MAVVAKQCDCRSMPIYFFDADDGAVAVLDRNGLELDGIEAARAEAVRALPSIASDVMPDGDKRVVGVVVRGAGTGRSCSGPP